MINPIGKGPSGFNNANNINPYGGVAAVPGGVNAPQQTQRTNQAAKADGDYNCKTCSERRYKDGSDDGGVSFQKPTKVSPGRSANAVFGHEREHFVREGAKAKREGKEVVSNTIQIHYSTCPECGRRYASGGETRTVTKGESEYAKLRRKSNESKVDISL